MTFLLQLRLFDNFDYGTLSETPYLSVTGRQLLSMKISVSRGNAATKASPAAYLIHHEMGLHYAEAQALTAASASIVKSDYRMQATPPDGIDDRPSCGI